MPHPTKPDPDPAAELLSRSGRSGGSAGSKDRVGTAERSHTFRPDIEGLRAVAVLAVLIFHAGVEFLPGGYVGVDVFFVISGYLITALLVREIDRDGRISLSTFYAQRVKRLLPSLLLVLLTVVVLAGLLMPPVRQGAIAWDVIASGMYVINWELAISAVDYFAEGQAVSPLQHIWSLAVEEQFYLVWPALLVVGYWCQGRLRSRRGHLGLVIAMATVTIASFCYNVTLTQSEAGYAYFSTLARGRELGIGGLLAMLLPIWQPGRRVALLLWIGGAAAVVFATVLLDEDTLFPGVAALAPTIGTAAIIAAGAAGWDRYPQRLLTFGPMRHVGRVSYAWYLWHWPPIVFATVVFGPLSTVEGLVVVALSYLPALVSTRFVEQPIRQASALRWPVGRALGLGVACTVTAVVAGLALQLTVPTMRTAPLARATGAKVLPVDASVQTKANEMRPIPQEADRDRGQMYDDGCLAEKQQTRSGECQYGDTNGAKKVVLFGDSFAMHWFPALNKVAKKHGWTLIGLTKSGCQPADVTVFEPSFSRSYTECDEWRADAVRRISKEEPELVVTSSMTSYTVTEGGEKLDSERSREKLRSGYVRTLKSLRKKADKVEVIDDVPKPRSDVLDCVASQPDKLDRCAAGKDAAVSDTPLADAARSLDDVRLIKPDSALCPDTTCPAVIGNVLVYRNAGHLSATYAETLDGWLEERLATMRGQ
ncbi:MAG: acyltransferase family protein [Actinophytocola sp.]|nr:acyltransferase family protein [Actinophytocola sp.]